ncbi:MAG: hypothetical protein JWN65_4184 [Solirubrobacterales bacterium]|nr:hypothetical protein [Solirubrobacterales bacterium]
MAKHAHAGRVRLRLSATATRLDLTVEDNGRGFATAQPHRAGGYGMVGMRERATIAGGDLRVTSAAAGTGTTLTLSLPL